MLAIAGFATPSLSSQDESPDPASAAHASRPTNPVRTQVVQTQPFVIDRIYLSMKGPQRQAQISIGDPRSKDLLWILSYETEILDSTSGQHVSDEFMCHNNIDFPNVTQHRKWIGAEPVRTVDRMFTLSQGLMKVEFPEGFGIPMRSGEPVFLNSQVLNLNPIDEPIEVRYRTTVRYVLESERVHEIKPLYQFGMMGLKLLEGEKGYPGISDPDPSVHGESCSAGEVVDGGRELDFDGQLFTNHWVVAPGREENHTLITSRLGLEQDVTVHYIAVHLHPFAESLELRDLTANKTVFKSLATNRMDRIGLEHVDSYSSSEGVELHKGHEYTLVSVYQNDSGSPQDAMASMFLYIADTAFNQPSQHPN